MGYYKVEDENLKQVFYNHLDKCIQQYDLLDSIAKEVGATDIHRDQDKIIAFFKQKQQPSDLTLWKKYDEYYHAPYKRAVFELITDTARGMEISSKVDLYRKRIPMDDCLKAIHFGLNGSGFRSKHSRIRQPDCHMVKNEFILLRTNALGDRMWDISVLPTGAIIKIPFAEYNTILKTYQKNRVHVYYV